MNSNWQYSTTYNIACKVLDTQTLWNQTICRIWLPDSDTVVKVPFDSLMPIKIDIDTHKEVNKILYISSATKIAQAIENSSNENHERVLLAPMESNVIPLPHQISALKKAISKEQIRYLVADEVGLGKTIEAGLILRELKLRGLARRILVIAPKSIATQWASEMQTHFNEEFQLVLGEDISSLKRIASAHGSQNQNPWSVFDQVIVTLDSVKPLDKRRGWSDERIAAYNGNRYEDLITAGWDLVIVDEAHRLGGSSEQVARHKLGRGLADAAPYMLLLSATPHQGKRDAFYRLMSLLDSETFLDEESITKERVAEYTIRTEKRKAIDGDGKPLFKPRVTQMLPVKWREKHVLQKELYEAVTEYIRLGYNQAIKDKKRHIGFLMVLMQRLVVSSTRAIRTTLQRRLEALTSTNVEQSNVVNISDEELYDMDAQELLDQLLQTHMQAVKHEVSEVQSLLELAQKCEATGTDAKAETLIEKIFELQQEENDPELKVLIFTEFVPTQQMLIELLQSRGISVVFLNGSMSMQERQSAQSTFAENARVLISTDAGGEGLNLQFCHVVINYDIPWNPMRLEQRIGRVDRIGQPHIVRAINFVLEESVEFRVREVLEEKLQIIYQEFGIDKTGDVLDSAQAGEIFEEIFTSAILQPDAIEQTINANLTQMKHDIEAIRKESEIYTISDEHDPVAVMQMKTHPLPYWVERMTTSYLKAFNGQVTQKQHWWELKWPDGTHQKKVVFNIQDAFRYNNTNLLNLENTQVRELTLNLPQVTDTQPIPIVQVEGLPRNISGYWGLYEIRLRTNLSSPKYVRASPTKRDFITLFISNEGKLFLPTSRHIWDVLQTAKMKMIDSVTGDEVESIYANVHSKAEEVGYDTYRALQNHHLNTLDKEKDRGEHAFQTRQKAIMKLGLEEVKNYRLKKLNSEKQTWGHELNALRQVVPDIKPLIIMKIDSGAADA
jgi:superfamily II DNA or RNA helicase